MEFEGRERGNGLKVERTSRDIYTLRPSDKRGKKISTITEGCRKEVFSRDNQVSEKEGKDYVQKRG